MGSGYVVNFNNRTFEEFIIDSVQRDVYGGKYDYASNSKANLMRRFWELEPNHVVGKLLRDLIELTEQDEFYDYDTKLLSECKKISERLRQGAPVEELDAISEDLTEKDFELLIKSIRASIDANEPQAGLDRLHTFVTKYLRRLCEKKEISVPKNKPLHSLMGEYIKKLKCEGGIETVMTERILKSSIANLEAFNPVRNDHSLAHDNPILSYNEALLIFSNIVSSIRFIQALERIQSSADEVDSTVEDDDLPF